MLELDYFPSQLGTIIDKSRAQSFTKFSKSSKQIEINGNIFTMKTQYNLNSVLYRLIGVERVKVTGEPESLTQTVAGSLPTCSTVKPWVLEGREGKVTGMVSLQVFPLAETVTAVIFPLLVV
jgi:hypothetical protein